MLLRTLHRTVGLIFAPFFLLTAGTGALLLFRATGRFDGSTIHLLIGLHNWELAARYVGVVLAGALVFMSVTGLMLLGETYLRKRRARAAPRQG